MEARVNLTLTEKLAVTLSVVFAALIIAASVSVCWWCYSLSKKKKMKYAKEISEIEHSRSTDDIEKDIRALNKSTETSKAATPAPVTSVKDDGSVEDLTIIRPSVLTSSSSGEDGEVHAPISVTRLDSATLTKAQSTTQSSQASIDADDLIPLPESHISTVGSQLGHGNSALLWPDVCDPYHRNHDLELRIGDAVTDTLNSA